MVSARIMRPEIRSDTTLGVLVFGDTMSRLVPLVYVAGFA